MPSRDRTSSAHPANTRPDTGPPPHRHTPAAGIQQCPGSWKDTEKGTWRNTEAALHPWHVAIRLIVATRGTMAHASTPFDRLAERIRPSRVIAGTPECEPRRRQTGQACQDFDWANRSPCSRNRDLATLAAVAPESVARGQRRMDVGAASVSIVRLRHITRPPCTPFREPSHVMPLPGIPAVALPE